MSVATDLQAEIARLSVAIAGGDTFGRVELDRLRTVLGRIREDAAEVDRQMFRTGQAFATVVEGISAGVRDLDKLAQRARTRQQEAGAIVLASQQVAA